TASSTPTSWADTYVHSLPVDAHLRPSFTHGRTPSSTARVWTNTFAHPVLFTKSPGRPTLPNLAN
ncbi:hypothetical protein EIP91_007830, partial [Steccherinum ochraceum]